MLKVGHRVKHLYDNPECPLGEGRVLVTRRGNPLVMVQRETGARSEHMAGALARVVEVGGPGKGQ